MILAEETGLSFRAASLYFMYTVCAPRALEASNQPALVVANASQTPLTNVGEFDTIIWVTPMLSVPLSVSATVWLVVVAAPALMSMLPVPGGVISGTMRPGNVCASILAPADQSVALVVFARV